MAPRFSKMPTLGEFVAHTKRYGFTRRLVTFESARLGRVTMIYLWRDVVETLCRQLGIPGEDFGL